jgi:hypothetical protein
MRQCGPHVWKTLQHVKLARSQTLRLPVIPPESTMVRSAELIGERAQDSERVFRFSSSRASATCRTAVRFSAGEAKGWGHPITGSR